MKKRYLTFFLVFLAIILSLTILLFVRNYTSFSVFDIKAVYQNFGVSILIDKFAPNIIITSPTNTTYNTLTIDLNFSTSDSASGVNATWYNIDNGQNTTLTSNTTFNISSNGGHTVYVFANDNAGLENGTEYVSFSVLVNKTVLYSEFTGQFTTNFSLYDDQQLESMANVVLQIPNYGMITFFDIITISDIITDLDSNVDITSSNIYLNTNNLPNFDKHAALSLYNLTFANPRILMDGVACPSSIYTKESYINGILTFNVTGMGNYSADETPSEQPSAPPAGGGGAGGGSFYLDFTVNPSIIKVKLYPGESSNEKFVITNKGSKQLALDLKLSMFGSLAMLSKDKVVLEPDQSDTVGVFFNVGRDVKPGVYTGKIIVEGNDLRKQVMLVVEVESPEKLLDVRASVQEQYKVVNPGSPVYANIELFSMGPPGRVDVNLKYGIKDSDNNIITSESTTIAIETQASLVRYLVLPVDVDEGTYTFYVEAYYAGSTAISTDEFEVVKKEVPGVVPAVSPYTFIGGVFILLALIFVFIVLWKWFAAFKRRKKEEAVKPKAVVPTPMLEDKEKLLEDLHNAGLISDEAYRKDKERIKHTRGYK